MKAIPQEAEAHMLTPGPTRPGHPLRDLQNDGGEPLEDSVRAAVEERLGHDFGRVRIHADERAGASARELRARAYTVGSHVVFAPGAYAPARAGGRRLLLHELAHVVQQEGSGPPSDTERLVDQPTGAAEREAVSVADEAMRGGRARPTVHSALRPQRQGDAGAAPTAAPTWEQQVNAAKAETDEAKKLTALARLVRQAVGASTTVHSVPLGKTLDPSQLKTAPVVNFDLNLNRKQSWPATKGAPTRQLTRNYGYSFSKGADRYVVLGPNALDARSPLFTEMFVAHELFHVARHLRAGAQPKGAPAKSDADEELEAWTNDFTTYFERLFQFRQQWAPLLGYYEEASAAARKASLASIVAFYRGADPNVQSAVDRWLKRRQGDPAHASLELIKDLAAALSVPSKAPAPASTP